MAYNPYAQRYGTEKGSFQNYTLKAVKTIPDA